MRTSGTTAFGSFYRIKHYQKDQPVVINTDKAFLERYAQEMTNHINVDKNNAKAANNVKPTRSRLVGVTLRNLRSALGNIHKVNVSKEPDDKQVESLQIIG